MKIVLLDEARERFEVEDRWWREHRDATGLFVTEFEDVVRQLASAPALERTTESSSSEEASNRD